MNETEKKIYFDNEKFKSYLKEKKVHKGSLCRQTGISYSGFFSILTEGVVPSSTTLARICAVLDVPMETFFVYPEKK